jgi:hypothetical protein
VTLKDLDAHEQLALVGLLRLVVRLDGTFSEAERGALGDVAAEVGEQLFWDLVDRAGASLSTDEAIQEQAMKVVRPEARRRIYEVVRDVAASDSIVTSEQRLLDWLREHWSLRREDDPYRT